ncbi:hypothetical protein FOXYSP1_04401 [Fusarium oxysporum f. sp. phaseoli]
MKLLGLPLLSLILSSTVAPQLSTTVKSMTSLSTHPIH